MALRQEVASQAVGDFAGIDLVVLLLGRGDRLQHQRMRDLHRLRMQKQVVINPSGEDRRFHGDHAGLWHRPDPAVQFPARRSDLDFLIHTASCVLHAIADRLLVYIQSDVIHSDVIHIVSEEPPRLVSESASSLSSPFATPRAPH